MTIALETTELSRLTEYISASRQNFLSCFDLVEHSEVISGITCETHMYHLKFDGNLRPKVDQLCECLVQHIIDYSLNARTRPSTLTSQDAVRLTQQARRLFIQRTPAPDDPDETGQAGELLLYFLLEAAFGVPQVVAKMDLKTNPNLEVFGSDGIHMAWNEREQLVDLYFGESKVYQSIGAAITRTLASLESFHQNDMRRHECSMVTSHFKYADPRVQEIVSDILDHKIPEAGVRLRHACLIGYNWDAYGRLGSHPTVSALTEEFREMYRGDAARIHNLLQQRIDGFERKHLFLEILFIPFECVQSFRDAFNRALA